MSDFTAPLDLRSLPEGKLMLLRSLTWLVGDYTSPSGAVTVPRGFVCDGGSIPRWFWPVIGHPLSSSVIRAACVHDWLYHIHAFDDTAYDCSRREADAVFREALAVDGVGFLRRHLMWAAVRVFGLGAWMHFNPFRVEVVGEAQD